jgi:transposase-like protein
MNERQRTTREQRRQQVERCLAADMTVKEWCELNGVSKSTMYYWMARLRKEEPGLFGDPTCGEWIELSRGSITARTALAVRTSEAEHASAPPEDAAAAPAQPAGALVVRVNGADVVVPEGATEAHVALVLRAVASL